MPITDERGAPHPPPAVELVGRYATERRQVERFADWVRRIGAENLKADLEGFDTMPAYAEDPSLYPTSA